MKLPHPPHHRKIFLGVNTIYHLFSSNLLNLENKEMSGYCWQRQFYHHCKVHQYQVPYGIMVPPSVDNLLVAGRYFPPSDFICYHHQAFFEQLDFICLIRCVAGDKTSHCAMRNMMACTVTGQTQIQIQRQFEYTVQ